MVTSVGHGSQRARSTRPREQAARVSFIYNQQFTSPAQEALAAELTARAPPASAACTSSPAGRRRTRPRCGWRALPRRARRARAHADRLARPGLPRADDGHARPHRPPRPAPPLHAVSHPAPAHPALDVALRPDPARPRSTRSTGSLEEAGPGSVAAFFAEPVSAAALPGYSPPDAFWRGLDERRDEHGFLICLDEVVTGLGPDRDLVRGRAAADRGRRHHDGQGPGRRLRGDRRDALPRPRLRRRSRRARARSSTATPGTARRCPAPSGAPCSPSSPSAGSSSACASAAPRCATSSPPRSRAASIVREVRGRGFLLGVDYVDPRDGRSFLPRRARRRAPDRHRGARERADRLLDAADRRRLRRRPDAARARRSWRATTSCA